VNGRHSDGSLECHPSQQLWVGGATQRCPIWESAELASRDPQAESNGKLSDPSGAEEQGRESAKEPVARREAGCPPATTTKHDELLLENEILSDHRSHATATTQLRGHHDEVEQDEQEVLHA
jgi:hypothetical protein